MVATLLTILLLTQLIPPARPLLDSKKTESAITADMNMKILAIGDSLTEGIGDTTNSGGYVPLLASGLNDEYHFKSIETFNHGKSGNKTTQVTTRIKDSEEIQDNIQDADIIVITIGANDLMKVVKANLLNGITVDTFKAPRKEYVNNITTMYKTIRKYNEDAPIYQLGIYNPFYLNFQDIKEMQDVVDMWNVTTKEFVEEQENAFFIPINDQIYQGLGVSSDLENQNNLLSEDDSFHPNNTGYQIIANALRDKIMMTQESWIKTK